MPGKGGLTRCIRARPSPSIVPILFLLTCLGAKADEVTYVDTFTCVGGPFGLRLPLSLQELRRYDVIEGERVVSTHSWGEYDTHEEEIWFDGLRLSLITFSNNPARYLLARASVTKPGLKIAGPLWVGQPSGVARETLREFGVALPQSRSFGSEAGTVTIYFEVDTISEIRYSCYTG